MTKVAPCLASPRKCRAIACGRSIFLPLPLAERGSRVSGVFPKAQIREDGRLNRKARAACETKALPQCGRTVGASDLGPVGAWGRRSRNAGVHAHPYAKSLFSIVTLASFNFSLASERLRNSRDSAGSSVLVMMLSIIRPPVSGSLHIDTM